MKVSAVLFFCSMNTVRSPMASALAKRHLKFSTYIASAGVRGGQPDPFVIEVMREQRVDLTQHEPHAFSRNRDSGFDLIVSLSDEAEYFVRELERLEAFDHERWHVDDPTLSEGPRHIRLDAYRKLRDDLDGRIRQRFSAP